MAKCKICGARLEDGVAVCPRCGAKAGDAGAMASAVVSASVQKTTCPACGAEVVGEHRFCPQCGVNLKETAEEKMAAPVQKEIHSSSYSSSIKNTESLGNVHEEALTASCMKAAGSGRKEPTSFIKKIGLFLYFILLPVGGIWVVAIADPDSKVSWMIIVPWLITLAVSNGGKCSRIVYVLNLLFIILSLIILNQYLHLI